jgi:hypothetical protein
VLISLNGKRLRFRLLHIGGIYTKNNAILHPKPSSSFHNAQSIPQTALGIGPLSAVQATTTRFHAGTVALPALTT